MPGQPGNTNAVKTGRRSARMGFVLTRLGKGFGDLEGALQKMRKGWEEKGRDTHGIAPDQPLPPALSKAVDGLLCEERVKRFAQRASRKAQDAGDLDKAVQFEEIAARASRNQVAHVATLTTAPKADPLAFLYESPASPSGPSAGNGQKNTGQDVSDAGDADQGDDVVGDDTADSLMGSDRNG